MEDESGKAICSECEQLIDPFDSYYYFRLCKMLKLSKELVISTYYVHYDCIPIEFRDQLALWADKDE